MRIRVIPCDEPRVYMGPKCARIPRGAIVRLIAKVYAGRFRTGFFEYRGEKYCAPLRVLHKPRINKPDFQARDG